MQTHQIQDDAALSAALASGPFLLLKHSERCEISREAFEQVRTFVARHPAIAFGWVDVRGQRTLSTRIAELTGVAHASPQVLWIVGGRAVWHASHAGVTQAALALATATATASARPT